MKKFKYTINGIKYEVEVQNIEDNIAEVDVNGTLYTVEMEKSAEKSSMPKIKRGATPGAVPPVARPAAPQAPKAAPAAQAASAPAAAGSGAPIKSPLPGVILDILVNVGDSVKRGQKLMVLEAMKMENDIKADRDGTVTSINVQKNDNIQEGTTLITIG